MKAIRALRNNAQGFAPKLILSGAVVFKESLATLGQHNRMHLAKRARLDLSR